jgi:hypothetical protein
MVDASVSIGVRFGPDLSPMALAVATTCLTAGTLAYGRVADEIEDAAVASVEDFTQVFTELESEMRHEDKRARRHELRRQRREASPVRHALAHFFNMWDLRFS